MASRSSLARVSVSAEVLQALRNGQKAACKNLSDTEKMRILALNHFCFDEELESLEKELRRDLFWRGAKLSHDTKHLESKERLQLSFPEPEQQQQQQQQLPTPSSAEPGQQQQQQLPTVSPVGRPIATPETPMTGLARATAEATLSVGMRNAAEEDLDAFAQEVSDYNFVDELFSTNVSGIEADVGSVWNLLSEEPWLLGGVPCTLHVMENDTQALIRFDVVKHSTGQTLQAIGKQTEFQSLCEEQTGLSGSAQVKAAISQLFHGRDIQQGPKDLAQDLPWHRRGSDIADTSRRMSSTTVLGAVRWHLGQHQSILLAGQPCTLTILENPTDDLLQFEVLKLGSDETLIASTTNEEFECLCREMGAELQGPERINAAIQHLFQQDCQNI